MLKKGATSNAWSQSDLEDLGVEGSPPNSRPVKGSNGQERAVNGHSRHPVNGHEAHRDPQNLSISLDFLKNEDDFDSNRASQGHRQPISRSQTTPWPPAAKSGSLGRHHLLGQQMAASPSMQVGGFSPSNQAVAPGSPFSSSNSDTHSPWSDADADSKWYRRTSSLVEPSDPVVLSSSQRSNRERSMSQSRWAAVDGINSAHTNYGASPSSESGREPTLPPSASRLAQQRVGADTAATTSVLSGSPSSASDSSFSNWTPEMRRYPMGSLSSAYRTSNASQAALGSSPGYNMWQVGSSENAANGELSRPSPSQQAMRRGASPASADHREYVSSPRMLETMPEDAEHHATTRGSVRDGALHRHLQHQRQRSSSSAPAYGLGAERVDVAEDMLWPDEGGLTARQSPVTSRQPYRSVPFGTESRRHSISAPPGEAQPGPASRRAVGFETSNPVNGMSNAGTQSTSIGRDRIALLEAETPRARDHRGQAFSGSALSEKEMAADLGQLNAELDRISLQQQRRDNDDSSMGSVVHPRNGYVNGDKSHGWSVNDDKHSRNHMLNDQLVPGSKSRSASVGPRSLTPPGQRAGERSRAESFSTTEESRRAHLSGGFAGAENGSDYYGAARALPYAHAAQSSIRPASYGHVAAGASGIADGAYSSATSAAPYMHTLSPHALSMPPGGNHSVYGSGLPSYARPSHQPPAQHSPVGSLPSQLSDWSLRSLAALAPSSGNGNSGSGGGNNGGGSSLNAQQDLGRGVSLSHLPDNTPLYVVGFKQGRTDLFFCHSVSGNGTTMAVQRNDLVVVEADRGRDIGRVINDSLSVRAVRDFLESSSSNEVNGNGASSHTNGNAAPPSLGMRAANAARNVNPKRLYGLASPSDLALLASKAADEQRALSTIVTKVQQRGLPMNVLAAELQWDRKKLTVFYTAASRVDFRALVSDLFRTFKVRLWLFDISNRRDRTDFILEGCDGTGRSAGSSSSGMVSAGGGGDGGGVSLQHASAAPFLPASIGHGVLDPTMGGAGQWAGWSHTLVQPVDGMLR